MDVGAYNGVWTREMARKYGCTVLAFEPVQQLFLDAGITCMESERVIVINAGLGWGCAQNRIRGAEQLERRG